MVLLTSKYIVLETRSDWMVGLDGSKTSCIDGFLGSADYESDLLNAN